MPEKKRLGLKQRRFRKRLRSQRSVGARRQIPRAAVPSFFTLMNLFCGFVAITLAPEGRYEYAAWLIVLAGFFDLLDGMMARLMDGASLFGVELDSLCDMVSFGVAPAFLLYMMGLKDAGTVGVVIASLPAICGAVRLARFNVSFDGSKKEYFTGLPIPMQAAFLVALILNAEQLASWGFDVTRHSVLVPVLVILSGLMISTIRFDAVPKPSKQWIRANPRMAALMGVALLILILFQAPGLLVVLVIYLAVGMLRAAWNLLTEDVEEGDPEKTELTSE